MTALTALAVIVVSLVSTAAAAPPRPKWLILAYLDGRGGLGPAVDAYEHQLRSASRRHGIAVAIQVISDLPTPMYARRTLLEAGAPGIVERLAPSATGSRALADFVAWGSGAQPAEQYALLVMGHGSGLLEGVSSLRPGALRPALLQAGLEQACEALGQPLDVLCLDTCYGATMEVLYGLRGLCRYVTAAPGLIFSPGLDWRGALSDLSGEPVAASLVRGLVSRGMARSEPGLALVGVDMARLGAAFDLTRALTEALRTHLAEEMLTLTWVRAHSRSWGDHAELADLSALAAGLRESAATPAVRQAAAPLEIALAGSIEAKWESEGTGRDGALGVYFPPTLDEVPPRYRASYEFASACGWADLLESYWLRISQVLTATDH